MVINFISLKTELFNKTDDIHSASQLLNHSSIQVCEYTLITCSLLNS